MTAGCDAGDAERDQTLPFFMGAADPLPIGRPAASRLKDLLQSG